MSVQIEESWKAYLSAEFEKPYFAQLTEAVRAEYMHTVCYPPGKLIFNAFNLCPFDQVKVVIIGQDPYHVSSRRSTTTSAPPCPRVATSRAGQSRACSC